MEPFIKVTGVAAPINRVNIDTDQVIPAIHLKSIERTGYGKFLFSSWRFDADGTPNPDFVLNKLQCTVHTRKYYNFFIENIFYYLHIICTDRLSISFIVIFINV